VRSPEQIKQYRIAWRRKKGIRPRVRPPIERLLEKREISQSGCWLWTGAVAANGYATTTTGSRSQRKYVHRIAYTALIGEIPAGLELDHLCRNRRCFNPKHLEPVTRQVNTIRGDGPRKLGVLNSSKVACKSGHPFNESNTYYRPTGGRTCRTCQRERRLFAGFRRAQLAVIANPSIPAEHKVVAQRLLNCLEAKINAS
jgi:hypothetical protein